MMRCGKQGLVLVALLACWMTPAHVSAEPQDPFSNQETTVDLSSEIEFFRVETDIVTSVSRHPESLWGAAAAIYVVKGEDIVKSGAESIVDALRMVPGLDVASIDAHASAVSARGFQGFFAEKMLVLLDGRPIYTPLFGGTVWQQWETFAPDIDRIEVIRGPGGALYGSNAVNGVINIITKSAEDTHGTIIRAFGGTNELYRGEARHGGRNGSFNFRVYGRAAGDSGFSGDGGGDGRDDLDGLDEEYRGGYRFDWDLGRGLVIRSSGEIQHSKLESFVRPGATGDVQETELYSGVLRIEKDFADGSSGHLQIAGDQVERDAVPFVGSFQNERTTGDIELQHSFRLGGSNRITWGANYRHTDMSIADGIAAFSPSADTLDVIGGFINWESKIAARTKLTLGTKVENNSFSGTNFQPSARLVHRFDDQRTAWASVSHAVNTPSYSDSFVTVIGEPFLMMGATIFPVFTTDSTADDTTMIAYEVGYRHRFSDSVALDATAFYNEYDDVLIWDTSTASAPVPFPTGCTPLGLGFPACGAVFTTIDNVVGGHGYGAEAALTFDVTDSIRGEFNTSYYSFQHQGDDNPDVPEWKFNLRTFIDCSPRVSIVPTLHWVDQVTTQSLFGTPSVDIDSYLRVDLAINYQPAEGWPTFSLVGHNITDSDHTEFLEELVKPTASQITREWFLRVSQEF